MRDARGSLPGMVAAAVILVTTVAHGAWAQSPPAPRSPAPPPRDVPGAPTTAPPEQAPAQAPDQRNRDDAPGSVTLPRIRPTAVDGIRTGAAPAPAEALAEDPVMPEAAGEPAADAPADVPAAPPTARPIAVIQDATKAGAAAPATVAMPAPAAAPAPAMTIAPDWPTLALLTMLVPAGVAAAWALNGLGHRRGAG